MPARHASAAPAARRRSLRALIVGLLAVVMMSGLLAGAASTSASASGLPAAVKARPTLKYGSRGPAVAWLQARLRMSQRTGYFGPRTRAAVLRYQRGKHLPVTGVVASRTWTALGVRPSARASRSAPRPAVVRAGRPGSPQFAARVVAVARTKNGAPYRYGGSGPSAFDCSGFVGYVYKRVGYSLPRSSAAMRSAVPRIGSASVRVGDLVFVHNRGGGRVGHVAIYAGHGYWWEASNPGRPLGLHKAWSSRVSYGRVR